MQIIFLLVAAGVVFFLGYRFYSKLLAISVFRSDPHYSTGAQASPDEASTHRYLLLGHHIAIMAAPVFIGAMMALVWGWIPAFLWLVVGTTIAAGTLEIGGLWLFRQHSRGALNLALQLLGPYARHALVVVALLLLVTLSALAARLFADVISTVPAAALPFWLLMPIAFVFGIFTRRRPEHELIPGSAIAFAILLLIVWLAQSIPLSFTGTLNLELRGIRILGLDVAFIWVMLILIYVFYATPAPVGKLLRPRGYLSALLMAFTLAILIGGLVWDHPQMVAPDFHTPGNGPPALPWVFITLGAVAGFQFLVMAGITARHLRGTSDVRVIGYSSALAQGIIGVGAIALGAVVFSNDGDWRAYHAVAQPDLLRAATLFIDGFVRIAGSLGLDADFSRTVAALTLISLAAATLEAGLRLIRQLLAEVSAHRRILSKAAPDVAPPPPPMRVWLRRLQSDNALTWLALGIIAVLAFNKANETTLWPLFGLLNLMLAVFGLVLLLFALKQSQRPLIFALLPLAVLVIVATWALIAQSLQWWTGHQWLALLAGLVLFIMEIVMLVQGARAWIAARDRAYQGQKLDT